MKVIVWGIGREARELLNEDNVDFYGIEAMVDCDKEKQGGVFCERPIIAPEDIEEYEFNYILIGSNYYKNEIKFEIEKRGLGGRLKDIEEYIFGLDERTRILEMALKAELIPTEKMKEARVLANRVDALQYMPSGGVVAEIGVAYGAFSELILEKLTPKKFYAIDYFNGGMPEGDFWGQTYFKDSGLTHQEWYRKRFKKEVENGVLEIKQGFSWEVLEEFPDNYFDYVYLDACHSYLCVKKDVEVLERKMKNGGIIAFNDYTFYNFYTDPMMAEGYYGVALVANDLVVRTNSQVLYLCLQRCLSMDLIIRYLR